MQNEIFCCVNKLKAFVAQVDVEVHWKNKQSYCFDLLKKINEIEKETKIN
jgi:hypothetical protein